MSEHFPFSATGAALLCGWSDDDYGLSRVSWVNANDAPDEAEVFTATVGFADARNVLRFNQSAAMDEQFAAAAAEAVRACLDAHSRATFGCRHDCRRSRPARVSRGAEQRLGVPSRSRSTSQTISACTPRRWRRRSSGKLAQFVGPAGAFRRRRCRRHRGRRASTVGRHPQSRVLSRQDGAGGGQMEQLTALDAGFLEVEDSDPHVSLAVGAVSIVQGPAPAYDEFVSAVPNRVHDDPAFRQVLRTHSLDLRPPEWADDPHFEISRHLHRVALPHPGGDTELFEVVAT